MQTLYDKSTWRNYRSRVLAHDAECALAQLAGNCRGTLHVHHVRPISEGGPQFPRDENGYAVLCARHHGLVHAWRKKHEPEWKRCPHTHRSREARELCERRLNQVAA